MKNDCMKVKCNPDSMDIAVKSKLFGLTTEDTIKIHKEPLGQKPDATDGFDWKTSCPLGQCHMTYKIQDEK